MTTYAKRYSTTLSQDEDAIAAQAFGKDADPTKYLIKDKSVNGLINAEENSFEDGKKEAGWKVFAKGLEAIRP